MIPPFGSGTTLPPPTPQPDPSTGAVPGERHGIVADQSFCPPATSTLKERMRSGRVGAPTIDVG
eukprot:2604556-Prymnesium_polylepis.2